VLADKFIKVKVKVTWVATAYKLSTNSAVTELRERDADYLTFFLKCVVDKVKGAIGLYIIFSIGQTSRVSFR